MTALAAGPECISFGYNSALERGVTSHVPPSRSSACDLHTSCQKSSQYPNIALQLNTLTLAAQNLTREVLTQESTCDYQ